MNIWDEGTYRTRTARGGVPVPDAVRTGHLSVWLEGEKLLGGWSLTRTGRAYGAGEGREAWILVKRVDDHAAARLDITAAAPESVRSGRRLADLRVVSPGRTDAADPAPGPRPSEWSSR